MSIWSPPDPSTIGQRATVRQLAWADRARRYRRNHPWCERCEWRGPIKVLWFWVGPRLEVHHCDGRGIRNPEGLECDDELMTLCEPCHDDITAKHRAIGRREGVMGGRNPVRYSQIIREVTDAARPKYLRRIRHRLMFGKLDT